MKTTIRRTKAQLHTRALLACAVIAARRDGKDIMHEDDRDYPAVVREFNDHAAVVKDMETAFRQTFGVTVDRAVYQMVDEQFPAAHFYPPDRDRA